MCQGHLIISVPAKLIMSEKKSAKHTVHWFRRGLRLHDNPSLREGLKCATTFRCIFILDPWFAGSSNVGINKWRYVICVAHLVSLRRNLIILEIRAV